MDFTYKAYEQLLTLIQDNDYEFCSFHNYASFPKCVIMRHDVDNSLPQALKLAEVEYRKSVKSTYFVLLNTDFYNVASKSSATIISRLLSMGHEIGLHFDETAYDCGVEELKDCIIREARLLSQICDCPVTAFSMHRPNKRILQSDLKVPGLVNSYEHPFFDEFKYLSDSRRNWKEPVEEVLRSKRYDKIQILTHGFWYHEENYSLQQTIKTYLREAEKDRYDSLSTNIRDLTGILNSEEI